MYWWNLPNEFFVIVAGIFGAAIGSFLHVCIWRIPREESIVFPASACPQCGHAIAWYDNIPLLSWIWLGAKCRHCQASISIRYPIYELLTALLFMGIVYVYGLAYVTFFYFIIVCNLIVASGIDWDHYYIPDALSLPMIPLMIVAAAIVQWWGLFPTALVQRVDQAVLGILVGGGAIWLIRIVGTWAFRQEAMGFGDVKLMAFMGGFLGWDEALLCIFLGAFFGSIVGVALKITGKIEKYGHIPFGPYLALGAYSCLLYGPEIILWYTKPFQL
ncbi:MAG: prepilin peptidase [Candidatus Hinthialibacter sp.]